MGDLIQLAPREDVRGQQSLSEFNDWLGLHQHNPAEKALAWLAWEYQRRKLDHLERLLERLGGRPS